MSSPLKRSIYLLAIWQERPPSSDSPAVWRIRLEDTHTGEQHGFTSVEGLMAFVQAHIAAEFGPERHAGREK